MCYHAEFGRSALKDTGEPQKLVSTETCSLWMDGMANLKIHASP